MLEIVNLTVKTSDNLVIIDNLCLSLEKGSITAIVGESGSGKSIFAKSILNILDDNLTKSIERLTLNNIDLTLLSKSELRQLNGKISSLVFQNPMTSLNPLIHVGEQIKEAIVVHNPNISKADLIKKVDEILTDVELPNDLKFKKKYPHQLSGGQKQRINIAMSLVNKPELLIADEPTTALDVTVQKKILDLILKLSQKYQTSIIFITHDLAIANYISDYIYVMYAGLIVEHGKTNDVLNNPMHPYTKGLLQSRIEKTQKGELITTIKGNVPYLDERDINCLFYERCPYKTNKCLENKQVIINKNQRYYRCSEVDHD